MMSGVQGNGAGRWLATFLLGFILAVVLQEIRKDPNSILPKLLRRQLSLLLSPIPTTANHSSLPPNAYDVTVITGFYDIGEFRKKQKWRQRTRALYHEWMQLWAFVENRVVAFFDDEASALVFKQARGDKPTEIHLVDRRTLPSYQHLANTTRILAQPGYPQLYPETSTPEYSVVNNLKYDIVQLGLTKTRFHSHYYAWIDIGAFNYHVNRLHKPFTISLPDEADIDKVMYTQVDPYEDITAQQAFTQRKRWLGAGAFLGQKAQLLDWCNKYQQAVDHYISRKMVCNDQAMLYGLTLPKANGGMGWGHLVQPLTMLKWHDRGYEVSYLFETTWRYPLAMCTEQINTDLRKKCLGM